MAATLGRGQSRHQPGLPHGRYENARHEKSRPEAASFLWPGWTAGQEVRLRPYLRAGRACGPACGRGGSPRRSEEHTSELQSLMRNSYAVFCLKKKKKTTKQQQ